MKTRIFTLIVSLFITAMAFAYDIEIDGIYYNLDTKNKTAGVTYGSNEYSGNIIIPNTIPYGVPNKLYSVTYIDKSAFSNCSSLTSITIPNSVTEIGGDAFRYCSSLTSITIPNSVTYIGNWAFKNCSSLTSITIPNSVTSIGEGAFYDCSSLTSITIHNSVTSISPQAFHGTKWFNNQPDGCIYLDNILYTYKGKMPSNTHIDVKEGTTIICPYAFAHWSPLTSITIPNSVTRIYEYAFAYCSSLTSATIGNSVTLIGERAFSYCRSLTSITIPNSVTDIGILAFFECSKLTSATIGNSVTHINVGAFASCSSLTSITIPNSVTFIGDEAFVACSSLTSATIGNSVTYIPYIAFASCSSLTTVTIGSSVTSIHKSAFEYCSSIKELIVEAIKPPSISYETFSYTSDTIPVKVPCSSISAYQTTNWKRFINIIGISPILTINVNNASMGVATITKQNSCEDNIAQVEAKANAGYKFVRWSDGNTENPRKITVTEDMTLTAEFSVKVEYTVTLHCDANKGTVSGGGKYEKGTEISIKATPNKGYHFVKWSDNNTENPRVIVVTKDINLTATFELDGTPVEDVLITSANIYSSNGKLHVEGAETDYYVLDMAGRLIYSGRDAEVQLPRGVYLVTIKGEVQKIVL